MNMKKNPQAADMTLEKVILDREENRCIQTAAMSSVKAVLKNLHTTLRGLDEEEAAASRSKYGTNRVTHEKKKSLPKRLAVSESIYGYFTLSGSGIGYYGYDISLVFYVWQYAGRF